MNTKRVFFLFQFQTLILSLLVLVPTQCTGSKILLSRKSVKNGAAHQNKEPGHTIHRRAFSFSDLADDLTEKDSASSDPKDDVNSAVGDFLDSLIPNSNTGNDVIDSLIDAAVSDAVDDVIDSALGGILDDFDLGDDIMDGVKDVLNDVIGSDKTTATTRTTTTSSLPSVATVTDASKPRSTMTPPTSAPVVTDVSMSRMITSKVKVIATDPSPTNNPDTETGTENRRRRLVDFITLPVTNFVGRLRNITMARSRDLFDALTRNTTRRGSSTLLRFGQNRGVANLMNGTSTNELFADIRSRVENVLENKLEYLVNDLYSVAAEFVASLTPEDVRIMDRLENNRTRQFIENNVEDVLPVLVDIFFGRASLEDLRCVITKSVLENQFQTLFRRPEVSKLFTDIFLAVTACYQGGDDDDDVGQEFGVSSDESQSQDGDGGSDDRMTNTTARAANTLFQAMSDLVNFRDEENLAAAETIADAMAFVDPSPSFNLDNLLGDLSPDIANLLSDALGESEVEDSISGLLGTLFPSSNNDDDDDDGDDDDDENNNSNESSDSDSYLNGLLSILIQPVVNPLPLTQDQKEAVTSVLVELLSPFVSSRIQQASQRAITAGVSNVLQQVGVTEEQAIQDITQQIIDLTNALMDPDSNTSGDGDGGDDSDGDDNGGGGAGGAGGAGIDLSSILADIRSSDELQGLVRALLGSATGVLGQNASVSEILPSELEAALGMLSTVEGAFSALTGIYSDRHDTSQGCGLERSAISQGLRAFQPGALLFVDSMGKPGTGILQGNSYFVGNFDQCTTLRYVTSTDDVIYGRYVKYRFVIQMPPGFPSVGGQINFQEAGLPYIVWGMCLPQGCNHQDARIVGQDVAEGLNMELDIAEILEEREPGNDAGFICTMLVLGILTLCCMIGTILDVIGAPPTTGHEMPRYRLKHTSSPRSDRKQQKQQHVFLSTISEEPYAIPSPTGEYTINKPNFRDLRIELGTVTPPEVPSRTSDASNQRNNNNISSVNPSGAIWNFFLAFSVPKNTKQILKATHAPGEITCLHGIRVISISWVILGHAYFFAPDYGNLTALLDMSKWWTFNAILNAPYTVDTFFVLSGCLVAYLFLKTAKKAGGLKPRHMVLYYVHRYLRLTPLLGLAMLFYASVTPYLEYGPFQKELRDREGTCGERWWWNILYINNLFDTSRFCMGWTWYLPNDMQFYAVAPLVIVPMAMGYNFLGILIALLQVSLHVVMFTYLEEKYDATLSRNASDYFIEIYIKPYSRCGPYAIGLILGYAIFKTKFKAKINKYLVFLGWVLALGGGLTLVFVTHDNYKDLGIISPKWSIDASNAYEIVARPLWALCLAWMIFACSSGYGGVINSLMSWRAWIPLSRLTYGVYLFHVMVIIYFNNNRRALAYFTKEFVIERYLSTFILSYGLAFIASLLIETPIRNLTKPSPGKGKTPNGPNRSRSSTRSSLPASSPDTPTSNSQRQRGVDDDLPPSAMASNENAFPKAQHAYNSSRPIPKRVTFENEPPRFGSNVYSSAMAMLAATGSGMAATPPVTAMATPTAPIMQREDDFTSSIYNNNNNGIIFQHPIQQWPTPSVATAAVTSLGADTLRETSAFPPSLLAASATLVSNAANVKQETQPPLSLSSHLLNNNINPSNTDIALPTNTNTNTVDAAENGDSNGDQHTTESRSGDDDVMINQENNTNDNPNPTNTTTADGADNGDSNGDDQQHKTESRSHDNLAYEMSDESDWLSAALADGTRSMSTAGEHQQLY